MKGVRSDSGMLRMYCSRLACRRPRMWSCACKGASLSTLEAPAVTILHSSVPLCVEGLQVQHNSNFYPTSR